MIVDLDLNEVRRANAVLDGVIILSGIVMVVSLIAAICIL